MKLPNIPRLDEYLALLRKRLPEKKVRHCLSVAEYLVSFAPTIGLAMEPSVTVGVLHDICREWDDDKMLRKAEKYGLPISAAVREKPNILHGPVAAEQCRRKLGIEDPDIYEAIYWHTTGRPGLNLLGQALYCADFAEPLRGNGEAERARALLDAGDFDAALRHVARAKIAFFAGKGVDTTLSEVFCRWVEEGRPA